MDETAREALGPVAGKAVETMSLWAEAQQRVLREVVELGAAAAQEGVRLCAELQQQGLEALQAARADIGRWEAPLATASQDPLQLYQKAILAGVDHGQKALRLWEGNATAVGRAAERMQGSAAQAGKRIHESIGTAVGKLKDLYSHN